LVTWLHLQKNILNQNFVLIEGNYSFHLKEIVMKMVKKNPDERISLNEMSKYFIF
jgi:hypothetical protein